MTMKPAQVAGDIMSKNVICVEDKDSLTEVARVMSKYRISGVVVKKDGSPVGIITERDLVSKILAKSTKPLDKKAKDIMSAPLFTTEVDTDLVNVVEFMEKKNVRRLTITEEGEVVGIITLRDIVNALIRLIKHLNWKLVKEEIEFEDYIKKTKGSKAIEQFIKKIEGL